MSVGDYAKLATIKTVEQFREILDHLGALIPCDDSILSAPESPLSRPIEILGRTLPNRFAIQPMEGWDGTTDGRPTENTKRRWNRFGESGAALIWGGEAVAVTPDGRANPNQLMLNRETRADIAFLRQLVTDNRQSSIDNRLVGLQ